MDKQEAPINNSPFTDEEIEHFEHLLNEELKETSTNIEQFENRLQELESKMNDKNSSTAHHQGNIGTSEDEREKYYTLIQKEKEKLNDIKMALDRIETGNYGICNVTGKPIQKERLQVKPYAKYSVDAVEKANSA
jgi:RNA polymerase-binding protein DksA